MAKRLRAAGFPEQDLFVGGPAANRGNLVARLRGRNTGKKPLLLLAHIDVVEADSADWTVPPFRFTERDGYFYGRGTTGDNDEAATDIVNLIRMKREGFVPDRDTIVALTAAEEGGEHNGGI
jgi:acetylornithine deacetylase/succinyl-diaminopimelate desuccinylase-like protein